MIRKTRVHGMSPDACEHEWTGSGWGDIGKGKRYSEKEAELIEKQVNLEQSDWIAWRVPRGAF